MAPVATFSVLLLFFFMVSLQNTVSADCQFPFTYVNRSWFRMYVSSDLQRYTYRQFRTDSVVDNRNDVSTLQSSYPCRSIFFDSIDPNSIYYLLDNYGSPTCAKSVITNDSSALLHQEAFVGNSTTDASQCRSAFPAGCERCDALWMPVVDQLTQPPPFRSSSCPLRGLFQLTAGILGSSSECSTDPQSTATFYDSTIQMDLCSQGTLRNMTFKTKTLLQDSLTCMASLGGSALNSAETGSTIFLIRDGNVLYCARLKNMSGFIELSINVKNNSYYAGCSFNATGTTSVLQLVLTPITSTPGLPTTTTTTSTTSFPSTPTTFTTTFPTSTPSTQPVTPPVSSSTTLPTSSTTTRTSPGSTTTTTTTGTTFPSSTTSSTSPGSTTTATTTSTMGTTFPSSTTSSPSPGSTTTTTTISTTVTTFPTPTTTTTTTAVVTPTTTGSTIVPSSTTTTAHVTPSVASLESSLSSILTTKMGTSRGAPENVEGPTDNCPNTACGRGAVCDEATHGCRCTALFYAYSRSNSSQCVQDDRAIDDTFLKVVVPVIAIAGAASLVAALVLCFAARPLDAAVAASTGPGVHAVLPPPPEEPVYVVYGGRDAYANVDALDRSLVIYGDRGPAGPPPDRPNNYLMVGSSIPAKM